MLKLKAIFVGMLVSMQALAAGVADKIEVDAPYVRMVPPNAHATAAFMQLKNLDGKNHALVSAKAYINNRTELHTHIHDNGVMRMRQVPQIDLPAGEVQTLQPGGLHVMLIGLNQPVQQGQKVKIDLTFEDGSSKTIEAEGRPLMPMGMKMGHHMMGQGNGQGMNHGMAPGMGHGMNHGMAPGMGQPGMMMSNGRNQNPMMLVMHANPAFPNLTGIAIKNAEELGLTDTQVHKLKAWTKQHGDKMQQLFKSVQMQEKELIQAALAGESKATLMTKFEETLKLRREIAETKIACRDNMRKVLTEAQFKQLASLYPMM